MPRGFLVKRLQKHSQASSTYRIRRCSDEDRSCDSTSSADHDDELDKNCGGGGGGNDDSTDNSRREQFRVNSDANSLIGSETATAAALLLAAAYRRHSDLQLLYSAASCNDRTSTVDASSSSLAEHAPCPSSDFSRHRLLQSGACSPNLPTNLSLDRLTVSPAGRLPQTPPSQPQPPTTSEKTLSEESSPPPPPSIYRQIQSADKKRSRLLAIGDQASEYGGRIKSPKKSKAVRRLHFDEDKSSPVSGTIIRELDSDEEPLVVRKGDIDPSFNVVEVTDEAKAEIAKIENKIGDYVCQLCKEVYDDAFGLAQHRCSRIVHVEYRCPECDKVFNCPANLASHRRWHKPRPPPSSAKAAAKAAAAAAAALAAAAATDDNISAGSTLLTVSVTTSRDNNNGTCSAAVLRGTPSPSDASSSSKDAQPLLLLPAPYNCEQCGKRFRRQTYLRRHMANHASVATATESSSSSSTTTTTTTTTTSIGASIFIYDAIASSATASPSPPSSSASSSASVSPHQHHPHNHHHHHNNHLHQQQLMDGANRRGGILSPTPLRQHHHHHHGGVLHQLLRTPSHRPTPPPQPQSYDANGNQRNMLLSPHHVALEKLVNSTSPLSSASSSSSSNGNPMEDQQHAASGSIMSSPYDCKYVCPSSSSSSPPPSPVFVPMRHALDSTSGGLYNHHRQATSGLLLQMVHTVEATQ